MHYTVQTANHSGRRATVQVVLTGSVSRARECSTGTSATGSRLSRARNGASRSSSQKQTSPASISWKEIRGLMECIDAADFFIVSFDGLRAVICTAKLDVLAHQWPRTDNRDTITSESVWTRISIERTQSRVRADVSFNGFNVGSIGWRRQNTQLFTAHCISQQRRPNGLS